jgi:predicted metal-dependent hydrolase
MARLPQDIDGVPVDLKRSRRRRRSVSLIISHGRITIQAPAMTPEAFLNDFLERRLDWVRRRLGQARPLATPLDPGTIERARETTRTILEERLGLFSRSMNLYPQAHRITHARRRWGSCTAHNRLNFSWRLALLPLDLVDYIIVHELAHIAHKNHGPQFWRCVAATLPDFRERRHKLRHHEAHV